MAKAQKYSRFGGRYVEFQIEASRDEIQNAIQYLQDILKDNNMHNEVIFRNADATMIVEVNMK